MKSTIKLAFIRDGKSSDIANNNTPDFSIEIECETEGPFAIHRGIRGGGSSDAPYETLDFFVVTHIPTGCQVSYGEAVTFLYEEKARLFVQRITPFARWDEITVESIRAHPKRWLDLHGKIKAVYESLNWRANAPAFDSRPH